MFKIAYSVCSLDSRALCGVFCCVLCETVGFCASIVSRRRHVQGLARAHAARQSIGSVAIVRLDGRDPERARFRRSVHQLGLRRAPGRAGTNPPREGCQGGASEASSWAHDHTRFYTHTTLCKTLQIEQHRGGHFSRRTEECVTPCTIVVVTVAARSYREHPSHPIPAALPMAASRLFRAPLT